MLALNPCSGQVYAFGEKGLFIELPDGAMAFQWEKQMTDQKAKEVPGGFVLDGSVATGERARGFLHWDVYNGITRRALAVRLDQCQLRTVLAGERTQRFQTL